MLMSRFCFEIVVIVVVVFGWECFCSVLNLIMTLASSFYRLSLEVEVPFGLKSAPASFQRFAQEVVENIPNVYVYMDDLLVYTDTHEEHLKIVRQIFQRFSQYGLALALSKCQFAKKEVDFLGYKISNAGITPLANKIQGIQDFPEPTTQKQLLRFLGMLNFYRKTLPNLKQDGKIKSPAVILQDLYTAATIKITKTNFEKYWVENNLSNNFRDAKQLLLNATTLAFPDPKNPLALSCDASDKHIGAVLEEYQEGSWRPIGYYSKHLSKARQNWSVFRRELLSIQAAIRNFKPDIIGRELIIFTDSLSAEAF